MKRFWHTCLAMIASATMTAGVADAQNNWNAPSQIGSYQSILSRAGYSQEVNDAAPKPDTAEGAAAVAAEAAAATEGAAEQEDSAADQSASQDSDAMMETSMEGCACNGGAWAGGQMMYDSGVYSGVVGSEMGCNGHHRMRRPLQTGRKVVQHGRYAMQNSRYALRDTIGQMVHRRCDSQDSNWVGGMYLMSFVRDYEDDRQLSVNPSGATLSTRNTDEGDISGYGLSLTRRSLSGRGLEMKYWALNPDASTQLGGASIMSVLPTLDQLNHGPSGQNLAQIYGQGTNHMLVRNTDINNIEVNVLNNGGSYHTLMGHRANFELMGGLRWFQFDESLTYTSNTNTTAFPGSPASMAYQSDVENDLVGMQLGARNEICINGRWRAFMGLSTGIFNNNINTRQRFSDENGVVPTLLSGPSAGRDFDYSDEKDDIAMIGELDMGMTYMLSHRLRARMGYRAFGAAGVALAADQIPNDFTDTNRIQRANSNGSLLMHGGYFGLEACF